MEANFSPSSVYDAVNSSRWSDLSYELALDAMETESPRSSTPNPFRSQSPPISDSFLWQIPSQPESQSTISDSFLWQITISDE